jgi:hypothetical protein
VEGRPSILHGVFHAKNNMFFGVNISHPLIKGEKKGSQLNFFEGVELKIKG